MSNIHLVQTQEKEYKLNFNSYAVMQLYRKYTLEQLSEITVNELNFDMIRWGLSDNGRQEVQDFEIYDFIDAIGGAASERFTKEVYGWIMQALTTPESTKKKEELQTA